MPVQTVYFDYNATTPLDSKVREAMLPLLDVNWGNPSSVHRIGRRARAWLDDARDRVARALSCKPSEIVFTSGGTESSNLAIFGTARHLRHKGRHIITSAVEHHAVMHPCQYLAKHEGFELTILPVDGTGRVSVADLERAIRPDTILVSVMAANNEIGTKQPVAELGALCRDRAVLFHTDAVQWFGKEPVGQIADFQADLVSVCAHKMHGPKGSGLLYIRSPLLPEPIIHGGGHENERRAGTENLTGIAGLVECLENFIQTPVFPEPQLRALTRRLRSGLERIQGIHLVGDSQNCLSNTVSLIAPGSDSIALLAALDLEGVCASSGSACSAGSLEPSHVIAALGKAEWVDSLVRFSLGRESTEAEVDYVLKVLPGIVARAQHHA